MGLVIQLFTLSLGNIYALNKAICRIWICCCHLTAICQGKNVAALFFRAASPEPSESSFTPHTMRDLRCRHSIAEETDLICVFLVCFQTVCDHISVPFYGEAFICIIQRFRGNEFMKQKIAEALHALRQRAIRTFSERDNIGVRSAPRMLISWQFPKTIYRLLTI